MAERYVCQACPSQNNSTYFDQSSLTTDASQFSLPLDSFFRLRAPSWEVETMRTVFIVGLLASLVGLLCTEEASACWRRHRHRCCSASASCTTREQYPVCSPGQGHSVFASTF